MKINPIPIPISVDNKAQQTLGILQITLASFLFGFLGIFGKMAFRLDITLGELLSSRFILASLILWIFLLLFKFPLVRVSKQQLLLCFLLGICGYAVFSSLYFISIRGVSASLAALLLYTYPSLVTVGSYFLLKEQVTRKQWLALPAVSLGLVILLWGETKINSWVSVYAGIGAAFCYSFYILASRRFQKNISPITSGLYVMSFASLGLIIFHRPNLIRIVSFSSTQILVIFAIALLCTIFPLILFLGGLQKLRSSQASLISTLEPVTAIIVSSLYFQDLMSYTQWPGVFLILMGVIFSIK